MNTSITGQQTKEQIFWNWFTENQDRYFYFEKYNQQELFFQLHIRLKMVDPNLVFEFSSFLKDGKRELVLSADGMVASFPAVRILVDAAPRLKNWIVVAFRQPQSDCSEIVFNNVHLKVEDVYFRYVQDRDKLGIELYIRNYQPTEEWDGACIILLDKLLGEYDTEMMLSHIERKPLDEDIKNMQAITALPGIVAKHQRRRVN